jgi:hypothetical protein
MSLLMKYATELSNNLYFVKNFIMKSYSEHLQSWFIKIANEKLKINLGFVIW